METVPLFRVGMSRSATEAVSRVLESGWIGQGPKVEQFEDELTPHMGGRRPVTTVSGTAAITIALRLAGVGPDTYVVTTPMTCSATNLPILALGAHPIWADIDPVSGLIHPWSVEERLREAKKKGWNVKAVMAVDWGGQPADYPLITNVSSGIPVIADAAHSLGANLGGHLVGTLATMTAFSFQAIKTLTTGDGGALVVPDGWLKRAKDMRWFGIDREDARFEFRGEQDITEWGFKAHMNDIAATIGLANLPDLPMRLAAQRAAKATYDYHLDPRFTRTDRGMAANSSAWLYTTLLPAGKRDAFREYMKQSRVTVSQVHWRNDRLSVFAPYRRSLPGVDTFTEHMICLPTVLGTPARTVAEIANEFFARG